MFDEGSKPVAHGVPAGDAPQQRRRMIIALVLLLVALTLVLVKDRNFWFPAAPLAESEPAALPAPAAAVGQGPATDVEKPSPPTAKSKKQAAPASKTPTEQATLTPVITATSRAVLPPLEVEVVAGDERRTVRPGSNSVKVDLQPKTPVQPGGEAPSGRNLAVTAEAGPTGNAAERVRLSPGAAQVVTHPVGPSYPLLARQMKVQGSVVLQALISHEGAIQDLRILSGPAILASAAREAVKQWRFKPYYQNGQPVDTEARITVNFTISTN